MKENKKMALIILATVMVYIGCASTNTGTKTNTGLSLLGAIEQSAQKIAADLPIGSRVAIVAFTSENDDLSNYIIEELSGALLDHKIEVADRQNLEYVYKELNFQMSGAVSDETAKSIGKFLGAELVITGQLTDMGDVYRYRTSAINLTTAVRSSVIRLDVQDDEGIRRMITAFNNQQSPAKNKKHVSDEQTISKTPGAFLDRGIRYLWWDDYDGAIAELTEAIKLNPDFATPYYVRGNAYTQKGNYDLAINDYTQAIKLNPNDNKAKSNLDIARQKRGLNK